jgi:hypothetical protein
MWAAITAGGIALYMRTGHLDVVDTVVPAT